MKIIILGAGQVGRTAAYHLAREEANDVTVVDTDEALLRDLQDRIDIRTVQGNGASPRTLATARLDRGLCNVRRHPGPAQVARARPTPHGRRGAGSAAAFRHQRA